ncbi:hypothetical protein Taro_017720, partial [Colocasia esculenta]|nr:hypothetical protein [Colocasia esculenta]
TPCSAIPLPFLGPYSSPRGGPQKEGDCDRGHPLTRKNKNSTKNKNQGSVVRSSWQRASLWGPAASFSFSSDWGNGGRPPLLGPGDESPSSGVLVAEKHVEDSDTRLAGLDWGVPVAMDLDDFEAVLGRLGLDLWTLIETAVSLAARDHGRELRTRRDGIVELLYAAPAAPRCQNCDPEDSPARTCAATKPGERGRIREERENLVNEEKNRGPSPAMPQSPGEQEEEEEEEEQEEEDDRDRRRYGRPVEDEQIRILAIKDLLDDPDQTEDSLIHMLQTLADMDITFKALKETDIGRHVNGLRKHPSGEIRRLVKLLVRKWKDLVDEWVKSTNPHETATPSIITDGDSPQQIQASKMGQSSRSQQVPDFGYSPSVHSAHQTSDTSGSSGSDKANNNREGEGKARAAPPSRKEAPAKPGHGRPPSPAPPAKAEPAREHKDSLLDPEKLASARRRLHENYQEAQNGNSKQKEDPPFLLHTSSSATPLSSTFRTAS